MSSINTTKKETANVESLSQLVSKAHVDAWSKGSLKAEDLLISLPDACVDEFDRALARTGDAEIPDTSDGKQFKHCYEFGKEMLHRLDNDAIGAVIVDRLPAERYNDLNNRRVCGMFSSFIGRLMIQNHAGVTLYDVKNTNPVNPEKVRKSITNHAQPYHADGGWHRVPAKYVGLYCIRNARSGGGSKITSMLDAFKTISAHPRQLQALLEHHPWDRQGEHAADEPKVLMNPLFEVHEDQFLSRYYESYVRNGYKLKGDELSQELDLALNALRGIIDNQFAIRFEMTSGQFQYLNNWTVLHGREAFNDNKDTPVGESRHVIRVWNHC